MVKSTKPSFPWDHIKAESMRSLCRDLGLKQPHTTRNTMIDFLESVWKVGLPKALESATPTTTPLSAPRTSHKRTRDTPTTVTTAPSSVSNGDDSSPSKRHRRGPDVTSDYNTRHKADRRGRLSDPGPIKRRRGRPSTNGTAILSAAVDLPVRTSKKRRLSPVVAVTRSANRAGNQTPATAGRSSRRVTLGEPLASDATQDDEEEEGEEEAETSISTAVTKRRRVVDPVVTTPRTRKQKEKEEDASTSVAASRGKRVIIPTPKKAAALNGVMRMRMDDDYQPEQDEEEGDYEDEDEEEENSIPIRQQPRRSLPARLPRRFHPRRRRPSASPTKATASPRKPRASGRTGPRPARMGAVVPTKASRGRGRPRRRPRANSVKFVFDGVDVPPVNVAWKKKKTDEETVIGYHDEDADGEIDEEVHPPVLGMSKEREEEETGTEKQEGEEGQEPTEVGEPEEEPEQVEEKAEAGELAPAAEEQGEDSGEDSQSEDEVVVVVVETGGVVEEQEQADDDDEETMDQGEDELVVGGLIPDDTSSLGNSNKENEAPEGQVEETTTTDDATAAEMAAQTVLFSAPITVATMTRVEYIVGGEEVEGLEGMEDIENMDDEMQGPSVEDMDDEMQGPSVEDINLFIV